MPTTESLKESLAEMQKIKETNTEEITSIDDMFIQVSHSIIELAIWLSERLDKLELQQNTPRFNS